MQNYLITSCLPDTPIDSAQLNHLILVAKRLKCRLIIIPQAYKNPTSREEFSQQKLKEWYPAAIKPYLCEESIIDYGGNLRIAANMRVAATSSNPLGCILTSSNMVTVLGHAKVMTSTLPTLEDAYPGVITTTGSLSIPRYSNTVAGNKSASQHQNKAILVLGLAKESFEIRHITYKNGAIYDLTGVYAEDRWRPLQKGDILVSQLEDIHANSAEPADLASLERWLKRYKPLNVIAGDLIDWQRYSHHTSHLLNKGDLPGLKEEISGIRRFLEHVPKSLNLVIQDSNHHHHPEQWLHRWPKPSTMAEAEDFHMVLGWWINSIREGRPLISSMVNSSRQIHYTTPRSHYISANRVHYLHGHEGYRGLSLEALSKLPYMTVSGHGHSPGRKHLALRVGSLMRPENANYMSFMHNWAIARSVEYANGAVELIYSGY